MKISAYIATLVAGGMSEDAAKGIAKGQAVDLSLEDDIGLTKPLGSGLVKGLVANGLSEEDATEAVRVAIAKGNAVDDLAATTTEPQTAEDAVTQLEAASEALAKGKYGAKAELDDEDDDDEDGGDSDDDGGVDGDEEEPEPPKRGAKKGEGDFEAYAAIMKGAVEETSRQLDAKFATFAAELRGIAKGIGAQGAAFSALIKATTAQGEAALGIMKSLGAPRGPRSVQDVEAEPHPSERKGNGTAQMERAQLSLRALSKGATTTNEAERLALQDFQGLINSTADDAAVHAAAAKLGL